MIPFNVPPCVGEEIEYVKQAIASHKICGDGAFTKQCNAWLEERFHAQKVLLTTSGTTALDMAMLLCDLQPGDEVYIPGFGWVPYEGPNHREYAADMYENGNKIGSMG